MRIYHVKKARKKPGTCRKCRTELETGDSYKWIKHMRAPRKVFCSKCPIRRSDMTTSDKLCELYLLQEGLEGIGDDATPDDIADELEQAAEGAREVGYQYEESADNQEEYFPGSSQIDEIREKASACDEWADVLDDAASTIRNDDRENPVEVAMEASSELQL